MREPCRLRWLHAKNLDLLVRIRRFSQPDRTTVRLGMRILLEHRLISVLTLLQTVVIVYGILGTRTLLSGREKLDLPIPPGPDLFSNLGVFLLLVPIAWIALFVYLDKKEVRWSEEITWALAGTAFVLIAVFSFRTISSLSVFSY